MSRLVSALGLAMLLAGAILCAVPAELNAKRVCCTGGGYMCCGEECGANKYGCTAKCPCPV